VVVGVWSFCKNKVIVKCAKNTDKCHATNKLLGMGARIGQARK